MQLICPAGNYQSLIKAIDHGADAVYLGLKNETNARSFAGLNFTDKQLADGINYAHQRGKKIYCAINTFPRQNGWKLWTDSADQVMDLGVDVLILSDIGVMDYVRQKNQSMTIHLSVQASATNLKSLNFYHRNFAITRAVIPRVLSLKQVLTLAKKAPVEIEVFGFGSLCIMVEGRCYLSSYLTGESPNTKGVCSPAAYVDWREDNGVLESRLNGLLIDRFQPEENAGYPTLCKGRFDLGGKISHALEQPTSLNSLSILPALIKGGVAAIKIEGRQRSPSYIAQVTKAWREAIDRSLAMSGSLGEISFDEQQKQLSPLAEGRQTTLGAYERGWQ